MVRKRQATQVRQRQIIDAARKVIIKYGSDHVTVKRIASEVGLSEAAVYRHFKSKREILSILSDEIVSILVEDLAGASTGGGTYLGILEGAIRRHLSSIEQRRGLSFLVIAEIVSLGDKKLNKKLSLSINKYIDSLADLISKGVKAGEVKEDINLKAAATALFSIIHGLVNIWAINNYSFDLEQEYLSVWRIFRESVIKLTPNSAITEVTYVDTRKPV